MMVQVAAALLFALAAALGATVILAMFRNNAAAILSALAGEGAFPQPGVPQSASAAIAASRRRRPAPRRTPAPIGIRPTFSRVA